MVNESSPAAPQEITDEKGIIALPAPPKSKFLGRPKGSKSRFPAKSVKRHDGVKVVYDKGIPSALADDLKVRMLELLTEGEAETLTEAAEMIGLDPARAYRWVGSDADFRELLSNVKQVTADRIEKEFRHHGNFIPKMMLLKAYRPEFRDNARLDLNTQGVKRLLEDLRSLFTPCVLRNFRKRFLVCP